MNTSCAQNSVEFQKHRSTNLFFAMSSAATKHERDQAQHLQGFLDNLQNWELSLKDRDKKLKPQALGRGKDVERKMTEPSRSGGMGDHRNGYGALSHTPSIFMNEENYPDAASEKELGNEYFKQKKFKEAIDCYSRSIALSPTAVAYANRAMSYIKIKKYQEAEDDCTEALSLDDRYIKAYSRRATARKELGKLKESIEDSEFALRLEPHNQEIKKQYNQAKSLYKEEIFQRVSHSQGKSEQGATKVGKSGGVNEHVLEASSVPSSSQKRRPKESHDERNQRNRIPQLKAVQEIASRAASQAMVGSAKSITPPTSAYQFEVSWRGFSGDSSLQARLLKAVSPNALPLIFKNALSSQILIDIIKCVSIFFTEEMDLAIKYLENLTKVARFDVVIMCLSATDKADILKIWNEVFGDEAVPIEHAETLDNLRTKYCPRQ